MKCQFGIGVLLALFILLMAACGGNRGSTTGETGGNTKPSGAQQVQIKENDFKIVSSVTDLDPFS